MKLLKRKNETTSIRVVTNDNKTVVYGIVGLVKDLLNEGIFESCDRGIYEWAFIDTVAQATFGNSIREVINVENIPITTVEYDTYTCEYFLNCVRKTIFLDFIKNGERIKSVCGIEDKFGKDIAETIGKLNQNEDLARKTAAEEAPSVKDLCQFGLRKTKIKKSVDTLLGVE